MFSFLFDINSILITVMGYPLSYLEGLGTLFGLLSVYWATRTNILTWPSGILNEIFFFVLFFQVQLYANMLLQVVFMITTLYGWYRWKQPEKKDKKLLSVTMLSTKKMGIILVLIAIGSFFLGGFLKEMPVLWPEFFNEAAAYPYVDALVMMISVAAVLLLARKKVQSWILWIVNDLVCIWLYVVQGVYFISIEYFIFTLMALFGLFQWVKLSRQSVQEERGEKSGLSL